MEWRSRLTLRGSLAGAPPGRPARAGLGRPSPCGALRGLRLLGGASLLEWERPAGQGGTHAFPRPERGWPRVKSPPEPPLALDQPARLPGALPPAGPAPSPRAAPPEGLPAAGSRGGWRRRCSPRPVGLLGSHLAPLGEGAELPRLEGGGAGRGARRTGTAAKAAARSRASQTKRPGKTFRKEKLGGLLSLFPPRAPTFFSKGNSGCLFSPAASSPTLPSPGPRARIRLSSRDWEEGESGSLSASSAQRLPYPAGGCRARWSLSPGWLTHPAPFPSPEPGSSQLSPPDLHPEVATGLGGIGARQAASRREKRGGGGRVVISFPRGFGALGSSWGSRTERRLPRSVFPFPPLGRRFGKPGAPQPYRWGGREGTCPARSGEEDPGSAEVPGETGGTGPAACPPCSLTFPVQGASPPPT